MEILFEGSTKWGERAYVVQFPPSKRTILTTGGPKFVHLPFQIFIVTKLSDNRFTINTFFSNKPIKSKHDRLGLCSLGNTSEYMGKVCLGYHQQHLESESPEDIINHAIKIFWATVFDEVYHRICSINGDINKLAIMSKSNPDLPVQIDWVEERLIFVRTRMPDGLMFLTVSKFFKASEIKLKKVHNNDSRSYFQKIKNYCFDRIRSVFSCIL